jgi:mannose-6-phosphate isomerase-like protein (cupin superfamily)
VRTRSTTDSTVPPRALVRCNLRELPLSQVRSHGGDGEIRFARVAAADAFAGGAHFVDYAELPPGTSIGRHRHADDEEELYLVLDGTGTMWRDGEQFGVTAGDLIRNRPGGEHGLCNTGTQPLRLFVIELAAR